MVTSASALPVRAALLAFVAVFVVSLWVVTIAPPLVSLALTVALAIGWCVWLEKNPDPGVPCEAALEAMRAVPGAKPAIHVIATTAAGTKCALEAARRLTSGTHAKVVLFVPRLTTSAAPFDPPGGDRSATIDRYRQIAADVGVQVSVLFCVGHRLDNLVHQMLGCSTLLIVGGRSRAWWPTRERRLMERLVSQGYPVVFADVGAAQRRAPDGPRVLRNS